MNKQEFEVRVMKYFAENTNLNKNWEIANEMARAICGMKFGELVNGEFEIPPVPEIKEQVTERVPYEFDRSDFMVNGPIDFSREDEEKISEAIQRIESLYEKYIEAQAVSIARTASHVCERIGRNIREEIEEIKKKHLL